MNPFINPYLLANTGKLAATGYGIYDLASGETNINNSGELGYNLVASLGLPTLGSVAGFGVDHLATKGRHTLRAATIGNLIGGGLAINAMRDRDQPAGLTSNIPMQEVQELNDLLGSNGAY